jgi:hypothetical protein
VEKKQVRNMDTLIPTDLRGSNNTLRYNLLSRNFVNMASEGCLDLHRTNYMLSEFDRIQSEMRKIPIRNENLINNDQNIGKNRVDGSIRTTSMSTSIVSPQTAILEQSTTILIHNIGQKTKQDIEKGKKAMSMNPHIDCSKMETLKNLDVVPKRGRPRNIQKSKRMIPTAEIVRTKQKITCSNCGSHEHNKATCTNPIKEMPSTKRKNTGNKSTKIQGKMQGQQFICFYFEYEIQNVNYIVTAHFLVNALFKILTHYLKYKQN